MIQYIDKDKAIAEIERFKKEEGWCQVGKDTADVYYARGFRFACERIINVFNTLEVKEVDLDNELDFVKDAYYYFTSDERGNMKKVAKHFFELGLKAGNLINNNAQKEE